MGLNQKICSHNPEVVGSSPASATKKVLKSKDFRTFSFVSDHKSWVIFYRKPAAPYRDQYHDRIQWTGQHHRFFLGHQALKNRGTIGNISVKYSDPQL